MAIVEDLRYHATNHEKDDALNFDKKPLIVSTDDYFLLLRRSFIEKLYLKKFHFTTRKWRSVECENIQRGFIPYTMLILEHKFLVIHGLINGTNVFRTFIGTVADAPRIQFSILADLMLNFGCTNHIIITDGTYLYALAGNRIRNNQAATVFRLNSETKLWTIIYDNGFPYQQNEEIRFGMLFNPSNYLCTVHYGRKFYIFPEDPGRFFNLQLEHLHTFDLDSNTWGTVNTVPGEFQSPEEPPSPQPLRVHCNSCSIVQCPVQPQHVYVTAIKWYERGWSEWHVWRLDLDTMRWARQPVRDDSVLLLQTWIATVITPSGFMYGLRAISPESFFLRSGNRHRALNAIEAGHMFRLCTGLPRLADLAYEAIAQRYRDGGGNDDFARFIREWLPRSLAIRFTDHD